MGFGCRVATAAAAGTVASGTEKAGETPEMWVDAEYEETVLTCCE